MTPPPQDPLRAAVDDLHRWDVSRGWPAFNVILARIDAALPAATEPADGLRLDDPGVFAERLAIAAYLDRPPLGKRPVPWPRSVRRDWTDWARRMARALRSEPVPGDGG